MAKPWRTIAIALIVLAAGLIGGGAALYVGVSTDSFRRWAENELSTRTGYAIGVENLKMALPLGLIASGVTAAKDGRRVLSAAKLNVTITPMVLFTKTIHRLQIERPVLEIDLAELLQSRPKSEVNISLRNLNLTDGRALIRTEDGNGIEIPAISLEAQNLNLGGQTGVTLRAEIPALDGIADFAIERRDSEISLRALVHAKPNRGLLGHGFSAKAKPIVKADATMRIPLGKDPTIEVKFNCNRLKFGAKEITGHLTATAALNQNFTAGTFASEVDLDGFPNSISPVALQVTDRRAAAYAKGEFSVTDKLVTIKSLTLRSHLGHAEAAGKLAFVPEARIDEGRIVARNLDWQTAKMLLPAPFKEWDYQGQGELKAKLHGPWRELELEGDARGNAAQVRGANFALENLSLKAPFHWTAGHLAVQSGRFEAKKFAFETADKLKSAVAQAEIGAVNYDSKKPGLVTAQVKLSGAQFASADSSKVGEGLALAGNVAITADSVRKSTAVVARLTVTGGELLWGKFFGDLKTQRPALLIDAEYSRDSDRLECRRCDLALATVGQVILAGSIEKITQTPMLRLQARSDNLSPAGFFQFFLRETYNRQYPLLDNLAVGGQIAVQIQLDGATDQLAVSGNLSLKDGEIAAKSKDWQIAAIDLNLPFHFSLSEHRLDKTAAPPLGSLSIKRARFGKQKLAPMTTRISLANNALRLHQPLRLLLFGGEIELRNLAWTDIIRDPKGMTFSADTRHLQMEDLTEAFNWPRFSGQLNGAIPQVESAGDTLSTRGEIQAELFGGRLLLSKLEMENPFSTLASIKMSAKLDSIQLEELSKTFAFGRISGILEGTIEDLVITNGQPAQLRADLHSVERSGVDQRISVDALNKITVLSSGQEAGALYGGLAGFFDSFRYSKLGFKATLRNDRLTLRGVESQGEKELLVVGSFLPPTVNIVSHTQEIAFSELLRRLERIKTNKPAIK